jgi:predicted lipoprotein with Yx(FWY)xxD motif
MRPSIKHPLTLALAIVLAAGVLTACGDDDGGDSADAAGSGSTSGIVSMQTVDGTDVLAASDGHTLYTADVERNGQIQCAGMCESIWTPTNASASEAQAASADLDLQLGVVKRPDGSRQLTLEGQPLYSFTEEGPGQLDGDGFVDEFNGTQFTWSAATTDGGGTSTGSDSQGRSYDY